MLEECYTFDEIKEKYNWNTPASGINKQITYAKNRGVKIEYAFKRGKTYFKIVDDESLQEEWKTYPRNPTYEVTKSGKVRNKNNNKIIGGLSGNGYIKITDATQKPKQHYSVHRMVMETFNPIENSDMYVVDHINGIRNDNRIENLRWVLQRQNMSFRDENWSEISEKIQKIIENKGYDYLNEILNQELLKI